MESYNVINANVLVIGSGTAGLTAALKLASTNKVFLLSKSFLGNGSSMYAQGGIAAVVNINDSVCSHIQDTLVAGDGLCNKDIVEFVIVSAKSCINWLIKQGVNFTTNQDGSYHLGLEGGHSFRRILHAADSTGQEIQSTLSKLVKNHPNIVVFTQYTVLDFIVKNNRCVGAYVLNMSNNQVQVFLTHNIILASGGSSYVYQHSTNPIGTTGDGIAIAYRAGCRVANLEFNQFHPTCFYQSNSNSFLLSEALRGEGGFLRLPNGERFMLTVSKMGELAPRDIVSRSIYVSMKKHNLQHVYLDMTHKDRIFLQNHFPLINNKLLTYGLNMEKDWIPVVPAAHYTCGGVMVDKYARTDLEGLYAIGEVAYTGLHGSNRLASNSLLECLVYAFSAALDIQKSDKTTLSMKHPADKKYSIVSSNRLSDFVSEKYKEIQSCMSNSVGIIRTNKGLLQALHCVNTIQREITDIQSKNSQDMSLELLQLNNIALVASLMIRSALERKESRGLHFMLDYRKKNCLFEKPTIINPQKNSTSHPRD